MAHSRPITKRGFWRSTLAMWLFWIVLGILLMVGAAFVSSTPALLHIVNTGSLAIPAH